MSVYKSYGVNAGNSSSLRFPFATASIEDQSIARAWRLGQTREVTVVRFVIEHTIEDRVMELQQRKRKLVKEAFGLEAGRRNAEKVRAERLADLRALLGQQPQNLNLERQVEALPSSP